MPTQLRMRLNRFLDQQHATAVMAAENAPRIDNPPPPPPPATLDNPPDQNTRPHWPRGSFGNQIANVQCVMIHETSGWPSYASANSFQNLFLCLDLTYTFVAATPHRPARWSDRRGVGPQYFVDPNGTAFSLIGPQDLEGAPRVTWHGENMNTFALGIENGNAGDNPPVQPGNGLGPRWWRLSDHPEDLTGMKVYVLLHPGWDQDAVLIWIAQFPSFTGSGDIEDGNNPATDRRLARHPGWNNMLFTERDYRTLALLCRFLAEQNGLPRNFPLLPYLDNTLDSPDAALFRKLILSDQRRDALAQKLGTTTDVIRANGAAFTNFYNANSGRIWSRFFGVNPDNPGVADLPCFRGFLSHDINGGHPCPGPLFDWHRFAREVWDWWWYPFDVEPVAVTTTPRPYLQARRDTQLIDYYFDATGAAADYNRLRPPLSLTDRFLLPDIRTPVYAMANGVVVAARFALSNNPAASGFLLVRHEVFHQAAENHIDYDQPPTFVWSLTYFLSNPGFRLDQIGGDNPDWLNRFVMRLTECELAVAFHTANVANAALNRGWAHNPSGAGPRFATGQEIERDATAYRGFANDLLAGRHVLFPLEANPAPTPVRVILGDFLGFPNRMAENQDGIQIEIFSNARLDVPGATRRACSASTEDWWRAASAAIRHEAVVDMDLPADGVAWHYGMTNFLEWINNITWTSEWAKYGVVDAAGAPVAAPPRPITRRVL
jgi:hypothetical protein